MYDAKQRRKIGSIGNILAITIHDLSQQRDLFYTLPRQRANFRHNITNRATALTAAFGRYDTKRAGMRTTVDDRYVRADQFALFSNRQNQLIVHHEETTRGLRILERMDFTLCEVRDQRPWVGRR